MSGARVGASERAGHHTVAVAFSWQDAFRDSVTWNAAWVFVKYRLDGGPWRHATLSTRSDDYGPGTPELTVVPVADGRGVLIHRSGVGRGSIDVDELTLAWEAGRDGVGPNDQVEARVFALDMVRVPNGPFYLGDGEIGNIAGHFRAADRNVPLPVTDEDSIVLGGTDLGALGNGNAYGMTTADDFDDTRTAVLPGPFPKGVRAFYLMRYEMTERQYAAFLNTLTAVQQDPRNPAKACASAAIVSYCSEGPPQTGVRRYGLSAVAPFFSLAPAGPMHHLSWRDAAAFADWAALRPFTELEYEKAARGPSYPEPGTYAWGSARIHRQRYTLEQQSTADEHVEDPGWGVGNAAFVQTMGDPTRDCYSCIRGPLRGGVFARDTADAEESGASYYRAFELSGNLIERTVSVGHPAGRAFDGRHGDGTLSTDGHAGGAEIATWPGAERDATGWSVLHAEGTGMRGGGWASDESRLRVSDRADATLGDSTRSDTFGYRFARTDPTDIVVPSVSDTTADSTIARR